MITADISRFIERHTDESNTGVCVTYARWTQFLTDRLITPDGDSLFVLGDHPSLSIGYVAKHRLVLFYGDTPVIEYVQDVTTRFIIDPAAAQQYDDITEVINKHTPSWFRILYDGATWWADVLIDGVTRRYDVYWQGGPKVWRRNKLGAKARRPTPSQRPTPDNPVTLDTSRDWVALARIPKDQWLTEDLQYVDSVAIDAGAVIREADVILDPVRKVHETLMQVGAELRGQ